VDSKTRNSEGLGLTLEESETLKEALNQVLPGIIHAMLAGGLIDPERVSDRRYLWSVVKNHLAEQLDNVGIIFELDKEFLAAAKTATKHRQPDGRATVVKVHEIGESEVVLETTHFVADKKLTFDVELVEIV
jgi:hypothetical protein